MKKQDESRHEYSSSIIFQSKVFFSFRSLITCLRYRCLIIWLWWLHKLNFIEFLSFLFSRNDGTTKPKAEVTLIEKVFHLIGWFFDSIGHAAFIYSNFICALLIPTFILFVVSYLLIERIPRFDLSTRISTIARQIGVIAGNGFSILLSWKKAFIVCTLTAGISVNLYKVAYAVLIYAVAFYILFFVVYVWIELELTDYFSKPFSIVLTWKKAFVIWSLATVLAVKLYMNPEYYFELLE